jgi:hypothetical protein
VTLSTSQQRQIAKQQTEGCSEPERTGRAAQLRFSQSPLPVAETCPVTLEDLLSDN